MEKYVFCTFDKLPKGFEKKSDAVKLEAISAILEMPPETLYILSGIIRMMHQYMDIPYPSSLTDDERDRCELVHYAACAKIECVQETLKWKRAVNYNFATGKHKPRPKAATK